MNDLKLIIGLIPGPHFFEIMHPFDDIPLAAVFDHFTELVIDGELIFRFPRNSRLFIDGEDAGRLVDVFKEAV